MAPQIELHGCFHRSEANPIKQNTDCSQAERQKNEGGVTHSISSLKQPLLTRVMLLKLYECWEEMTIATFPVQGSRGIYTPVFLHTPEGNALAGKQVITGFLHRSRKTGGCSIYEF